MAGEQVLACVSARAPCRSHDNAAPGGEHNLPENADGDRVDEVASGEFRSRCCDYPVDIQEQDCLRHGEGAFLSGFVTPPTPDIFSGYLIFGGADVGSGAQLPPRLLLYPGLCRPMEVLETVQQGEAILAAGATVRLEIA